MKMFLDPTIYIIDTENDFYICTKEKNLKLMLNEASRKRVYQIIQALKVGDSISFENSFDQKVLQLLMEKEMVTTLEKRQEISFDDIARISGPPHFIDVLKRECGHTVERTDQHSSLLLTDRRDKNELHITFFDDEMYISNHKLPTNPSEGWSNDYLEYAAYVFIEKMQKKTFLPSQLNKEIVVVDLSIYENTVRIIELNDINFKNFKSSYFMMESLNKGPVVFDFKTFFPFVRLSFQSEWLGKKLVCIGFNEEDAINNLLQLLARHFHMEATIALLPIEQVETEKIETLLKKLWFIKFQEEIEIEETEDSTYVTINKRKYSHPKTPNINPISYLLTLHHNEITVSEQTEELVR